MTDTWNSDDQPDLILTANEGLTPSQTAARNQAESDLALPQTKAFLDVLSLTEGTQRYGYNTAYGGGRIDDLSAFPGSVVIPPRVVIK